MEFIIKNKALDTLLEECISVCEERFPSAMRAMERIAADESARLINETALSADGTMLSLCKIPAPLYALIRYAARKHLGIEDFFAHKNNYYYLLKFLTSARVKRTPTKTLTLKEPA